MKVAPLDSHIDGDIAKEQSVWKERFIDGVLVSIALISLVALAVRLLGR